MLQRIKQRIRTMWVGEGHETPGTEGKFTCGTLKYTPATLVTLFGWLLWGDFTLQMMETLPNLLVIQFKDHNISNSTMAILLGSALTVCNLMLNPVYSSWSDRFRSRWGRRRPFLMVATPFVTLFLILIPWAPNFTDAMMKIGWAHKFLTMFPATPIVLMFGILIVSFYIFNMFIITIYYYLIPDTVPNAFIGRFYGMFRLVSNAAGILFSWFVYGYAEQHMRLIFAIFATLYAVSFIMMCWKVKEGAYPEIKEQHGHWYSPFMNYAKECFTIPRYWLIFMIYGCIGWAGSGGLFVMLFYRDDMGLTLTDYGRLIAVGSGASLLLVVPAGIIVDRLGSQKSIITGLSGGLLVYVACFFAIHDRPTALVFGFMQFLPGVLLSLAILKWTVDMYPRAQYGQFASAGSIVQAAGNAILLPLVGYAVDYFNNYYRICLITPLIFYGFALIGSLILYRLTRGRILSQETVSAV